MSAMPLLPGPEALSLRAVHRAVAELRRGTPVVLLDANGTGSLVLAAETAEAGGLAELGAAASGPALLLLSAVRAAAVLGGMPGAGGVVAVQFPALPDPDGLRRLANPTLDAPPPLALERTPAPPLAEAALALAKLARLLPAVLAAPAAARATARLSDPAAGLVAVSSADVLAYPSAAAAHLTRAAEAQVPTEDSADTRVVAFRTEEGGIEHLAILVGRPEDAPASRPPLVRVHSECFTGDLLGSLRCDCGPQLRIALRRMQQEGAGAVLYLAQEGRGIGLVNKLRAYALQDRGLDTLDANRALGWDADERSFLVAARMLELLGLPRIRLLTNNPNKVAGLLACGIDVAEREALVVPANGVNDRYLATKAERFGHLL